MNFDEDEDDEGDDEREVRGPVGCTVCGDTEQRCAHLLVSIDRSFRSFHGPEWDSTIEPALAQLDEAAIALARRLEDLPATAAEKLGKLWVDVLVQAVAEELADNPDDASIRHEAREFDSYLDDKLSAVSASSEPVDEDGEPGQSSVVIEYWAEDPKAAAAKVRDALLAEAETLGRSPSSRCAQSQPGRSRRSPRRPQSVAARDARGSSSPGLPVLGCHQIRPASASV